MTEHIDEVSLDDLEYVTKDHLKLIGEESEIGTVTDKFDLWRELKEYVEKILSKDDRHKYRLLDMRLAWEDADEDIVEGVVGAVNGVEVEEPHKVEAKVGDRKLHENAAIELVKAINEFKDARKFKPGMPSNTEQTKSRLFKGKMGKSYQRLVEELEHLRCAVLSFPADKFYHLISEFVVLENDRKYHNLIQVISDDEFNAMHDDWMQRIETIMCWIAQWVFSEDINDDDVVKFIDDIGKRKVHVKYLKYKSKNWYCAIAIKKYGERDDKNWTYLQLLDKIEIYMRRRTKKVTTEMLLCDVVAGELDQLEKKEEKGRKIKNADGRWYGGWKKNQPLQATTLKKD